MNSFSKSSFITNIGIFVLGMFLSFLIFSQLKTPITASIQDAFQSEEKNYNTDLLWLNSWSITTLTTLKNFDNLSGAILRISLLYDNTKHINLAEKMISSYWFSYENTDNMLTISFVLWQSLQKNKEILSLKRDKDMDSKDIPILDSVFLFENNRQNQLLVYSQDSNNAH